MKHILEYPTLLNKQSFVVHTEDCKIHGCFLQSLRETLRQHCADIDRIIKANDESEDSGRSEDCAEELLFETVSSILIRGRINCSDSIKKHYGLK